MLSDGATGAQETRPSQEEPQVAGLRAVVPLLCVMVFLKSRALNMSVTWEEGQVDGQEGRRGRSGNGGRT